MAFPTLAIGCLALIAAQAPGDRDTDGDGLSDFQESHKYFTDPGKSDSDGDGIPDGDWSERREFTYSVRAVMHVMAPFDVASMNDDYQDVRVLELRPDLLEFEVVVYPFNTVAEAIAPDARWRTPAAELKRYLDPGVCCNWDGPMQAQLRGELARAGIDLAQLDDVAAVKAVSRWLMDWAHDEDGFTTFAFDFEGERLVVSEPQRASVDETLQRFGRTLDEQLDRELLGRGMFATRTRGSCTSSAIYLSTCLKAVGIPTRTIVCVPIVDSSDAREVGWIEARLTHQAVRSIVGAAAQEQRGSWTSHTFNEVIVGGRWRRLNYAALGQNVLDRHCLGLMVHVHTFDDHAQAGLAGWGNRMEHPQHAALFGGPNPYSCVSLSDLFGAHSKVANEPLARLREATISRLYWYDDPQRDPALSTNLGAPDGAGFFFAHIDAGASDAANDWMEFFREADKRFVLRAEGREEIPARALIKYWVNSERDVNDFILRIEPADYARMQSGAPYTLLWMPAGDGLAWRIAEGVAITKGPRE
jgi:hypothetical protein